MNPIKSFVDALGKRRSAPELPEKKVLILEGGGMRGIFLTGILQAFTDRNFFPWKLVIGSSAGALTGTAYMARQIHLARDAFFTKLLTGKFIHLSHILNSEKHILDLDWMINTVVKGSDPLNTARLKKEVPVIITATRVHDNRSPETVYLTSKKDDIFTALKATAAIPYLYRGFVKYNDMQLLDGGLLDPIPFARALEMGYKEEDILVITTRPRGYRKKVESFWIRSLYEAYFSESKYSYLVASMENRYKKYNRILNELEQRYTGIDVLYPPDNFEVERLTQDSRKILEGFEMGIAAATAWMYPERFVKVF